MILRRGKERQREEAIFPSRHLLNTNGVNNLGIQRDFADFCVIPSNKYMTLQDIITVFPFTVNLILC